MKKPNVEKYSLEAQSEENNLQSNEAIGEFTTLCQMFMALEDEIEKIEEHLKEKKAELLNLGQYKIPDLAHVLGIADMGLKTGEKVQIKEDLKVNVTEKNRPAAIGWLKGHNLGSIVKNELILDFGVKEVNEFEKAAAIIKEAGLLNHLTHKEGVHSSTLKATLKKELEAGTIDDDAKKLLGVFEYKKTIIKR